MTILITKDIRTNGGVTLMKGSSFDTDDKDVFQRADRYVLIFGNGNKIEIPRNKTKKL